MKKADLKSLDLAALWRGLTRPDPAGHRVREPRTREEQDAGDGRRTREGDGGPSSSMVGGGGEQRGLAGVGQEDGAGEDPARDGAEADEREEDEEEFDTHCINVADD